MLEQVKKEITSIRILVFLSIVALSIHLFEIAWQIVGVFSDIIIILVVSWLLSFILEPLVDKINHLAKIPKVWTALIIYIFVLMILTAAVFLFIPAITVQIKSLAEIIPRFLSQSPSFLNRWSDMLISSLNSSITIIPSVAQFFFSIFIVLIISFYFIIDKGKINEEIFCLVPKKWHERLRFFQRIIGQSFASFLRVQLIFGITSGIITWLILRILGIDFAASIAFLAGIFAVIPLIGPFLSLIPPVFIALIADPAKAVIIFIILLIFQQFLFNVLGPRLLGQAFKLHPIVVLLSFLIGLKLGGGVGAILAIPVLGILAVAFRQFYRQLLPEI